MSLLLDALKKAELAKQIAKAATAETPAGEHPAEPAPAPRVVTTREKLPDITQPIEILSDDLPSPPPQRSAESAVPKRELTLEEPEPFAPATRAAPSPPGAAPATGRTQAEQLFQVKEMDYNPRRPFYLTVAALGVAAIAYGGYVWWQMQPRYSLAGGQAVAAAVTAPVVVATATRVDPAPSQAPAVPAPSQAAPARGAAVAVVPPIQPVRPRAKPQAAVAPVKPAPAPEQPAATPIEINAPILAVDPYVQQGYQAFQRNDLATARDSYQKALTREPNNRDALLGLAAIDVRNGQLESAEARYLKLLEADPRDSQAVAGLVALRGRLDPSASESRLKTLIAAQPESAHLQFALGNQYAQQARWTEAQAAYFKAYSLDAQNADYAYNLAVSLDQLHQSKPALEYYQKALALAGKRTPTFDLAQARLRVQELSK